MWRMLAEALAERASTPTTMLSARTTSLMCVGVDAWASAVITLDLQGASVRTASRTNF